MNIVAPGFMVAEQYRDRLVAAGVIDAEPQQQLLISDAAESSDAPGGLRTPGATSAAGETRAVPATACLPAAVSQTNQKAPAVVCSDDAGA